MNFAQQKTPPPGSSDTSHPTKKKVPSNWATCVNVHAILEVKQKTSGLVVFFFKNPTQHVLWMPKISPTQLGSTSIESHLGWWGFLTNPFQKNMCIVVKVPSSFFNHKNQQPSLFISLQPPPNLGPGPSKGTYRPLGCKIGTPTGLGSHPVLPYSHPSIPPPLPPSTPSLPSTPRNSLRSCWRHCFQLRAPAAKPIRPLNTEPLVVFLGVQGVRAGGFPVGSF